MSEETRVLHQLLRRDLSPVERNAYGVDIEFKLEREDGQISLYVKQSRLLGIALPD